MTRHVWFNIVVMVLVAAGISRAGEDRTASPTTIVTLAPTSPTVIVSVETDHGYLLADRPQIAYVRVGLRGGALEPADKRAAVNVALVIDKSGSMSGEKIAKAREAALLAVERLGSDDILSVVTYDTNVEVLVPATKVGNGREIREKIRQIKADGNTALFAGVSKGAYEMRKFLSDQRANRMILLSDGLANVGPSSPAELGELGAALAEDGISITTIGLGLGYNEDLMTQLAYKSDGSHYFAEEARELAGVFEKELGRALSIVAQDVTIDIECPEGVRPVRLLGRTGEINGRHIRVQINHIFSGHEKFALLEVQTPAVENNQHQPLAHVNVSYNDLQSRQNARTAQAATVRYTDSAKLVDEHLNKKVMADVVELIATEQNELAVQLRDKGQIKQAQEMLHTNWMYISSNAVILDNEELEKLAEEQKEDMTNIANDEDYALQRKVMRERQSSSNQQNK